MASFADEMMYTDPPNFHHHKLIMHNSSVVDLSTYGRCNYSSLTSQVDIPYGNNLQIITPYSFPVLLALGTLGNCLGISLIVYGRRAAHGTGQRPAVYPARDIFLLGLFVVDLLYLWNRLAQLTCAGALTIDPEVRNATTSHAFCKNTLGVWLFVNTVIGYVSQGMLVMFSVDRYCAITSPLQHRTSISIRRRVGLTMAGLVYAAAIVSALVQPISFYWFRNKESSLPGQLVRYPAHFFPWLPAHVWIQVTVTLGSTLIVIIFNLLILHKLYTHNTKWLLPSSPSLITKKPLNPTPRKPSFIPAKPQELTRMIPRSSKRIDTRSACVILLVSSGFYLLMNSLDIFVTVLLVFSKYPICAYPFPSNAIGYYEPLRMLFRHAYYALGFAFYVGLQVKNYQLLRSRLSISSSRRSQVSISTSTKSNV